MKFNELHMMQQLHLIGIYTEGTITAIVSEGDDVYYDATNDITIPIKNLKQHLSQGWILFLKPCGNHSELDTSTSIHYETSKHKGLDKILFNVRRKTGETYDNFGRFGLTHDNYLQSDAEVEFNKLKTIVKPFIKNDIGAEILHSILEKFLVAIEKIKLLPDSFFDRIKIDVPAKIILDHVMYATGYGVNNPVHNHRRYTPRISSEKEGVYLIDYERKPSASMEVYLGQQDTDIIVNLLSSKNVMGGGTFNIVSEKDTAATLNTVVELLTAIVNDAAHSDEYKPLLKRFLQYFNDGIKHIKNSIVLTKE